MAQEQQQPGQQQIQVKISDEVLKGNYSNQAMIRHTRDEFVLDFLSFMPGDPNAVINNRVILSPAHFKGLVAAMKENLENYEKNFGSVKPNEDPKPHIGFRTE